MTESKRWSLDLANAFRGNFELAIVANSKVDTSELRSANCEGSGQKCVSDFTNLANSELLYVWITSIL